MVENHALGILLGQKPCHPNVACSCSYEEDTPCQHRQTADEEGNNGRDDAQDDAGHHGSHHIAGDVHRLIAMAIGSQQLPYHSEADALPSVLGIASPGQAVDQFMNDDAHDEKNNGDAPVAKAS